MLCSSMGNAFICIHCEIVALDYLGDILTMFGKKLSFTVFLGKSL